MKLLQIHKKSYLVTYCFLLLALSNSAIASTNQSDSIYQSLHNGKISFDTKLFYMVRTFEKTPDPSTKALTFGGIMKYESLSYRGLKIGIGYYGNFNTGLYSDYTAANPKGGTSLLERKTGDDINFLGEAYLQYKYQNTEVKIGRQQLETPIIDILQLRTLPAVYEACVVKNRDIANTMIELSYVRAYSGFASKDNGFLRHDDEWGKDGLGSLYITNKSIQNLYISAQYVLPLSKKSNSGSHIAIEDYSYLDAKYSLPYGDVSYIKFQAGGNRYDKKSDSKMIGARVGGMFNKKIGAELSYNQIFSNSFATILSAPMYTDWQQGYSNYEPSMAYGARFILYPLKNLKIKAGSVNVNAASGYNRDNYIESIFYGAYTLNKASKFELLYSFKDQKAGSSRESRQDFRMVYNFNF
ncbi:OprD family outer membrane porin [Sulfurimonas paralvinellae]|uniref:OprD family porin n=1 Tax=Sulfurimonas paralvinellae TaxID=317658 RepID=A0A7M1B9S6_9BACT|nr:OprD family outer membrane porin [Sulfurimonas paralvinellae]QOP46453.1 OprD family porin [Sulfurimonas paralvinellae]